MIKMLVRKLLEGFYKDDDFFFFLVTRGDEFCVCSSTVVEIEDTINIYIGLCH